MTQLILAIFLREAFLLWKDSSTHMHGLAVYFKEGLPFAQELYLENSADSYLCFRLALPYSVSYVFFLHRSLSLSVCTFFDSILSNIAEVLSINPSTHAFVFGDFNIHHKDWFTYSDRTDWPGEFPYNFSISNDITQMVNFPRRIPDCDSHSPALLDLFLSAPFHRIAYDYSRADWDGLLDHLRDVPWEDIFKLGASAAAS